MADTRHSRFSRMSNRILLLCACLTALAPAQAVEPFEAVAPQRSLVIGSFTARDNAERWAAAHLDFGTSVQATTTAGRAFFRVLVGPLNAGELPLMQAMLETLGVTERWPLALCARGPGCSAVTTVTLTEAR